MRSKYLSRFALSLALAACVPVSAQAQFGSIGKAIKKKATEAVLGKDDSNPGSNSRSTGKPPSEVVITTEVLDQFLKGLSAENSGRELLVKRANCVKQAEAGPEYMNIMAAQGPELEKVSNSSMSDEKKMAELSRISAVIKEKEEAYYTRKCGPEVERKGRDEYEVIGAEAGGFTATQYAMLKERIQPFCEAEAKGGSGDASVVFSEATIAALRPRCAQLLPAIKKTL